MITKSQLYFLLHDLIESGMVKQYFDVPCCSLSSPFDSFDFNGISKLADVELRYNRLYEKRYIRRFFSLEINDMTI